jgi:hypothetical protein
MRNVKKSSKDSTAKKLDRLTERLFGHATRQVADLAPARLKECPIVNLREVASMLGIEDAAHASKASLVAQVAQALARLAVVEERPRAASPQTPVGEGESREEPDAGLGSKFNLGQEATAEAPRFIPWSYGHDRVTAMVVSPRALYVYWEVTDGAIEHARSGLGAAGSDAWLNLRVYDVSGRLFDGTNALGYADHKVERTDRQWFMEIGRPGSTVIVDLGMKSAEGYFAKIARSGRADFPRHAPAGEGAIEWLTVRAASGEVGAPVTGPAPAQPVGGDRHRDGRGSASATGPHAGGGDTIEAQGPLAEQLWHSLTERWWTEGRDVIRREWVEAGRTFEWVGPLIRTSWEAGPFPVPVEAPAAVSERYEGPVAVYTINGQTRVVFGPWQLVIRGLGGWAERRVLARWEVFTSWIAGEGVVRELRERSIAPTALPPGASEAAFAGASELRWLVGSELRLAGASEVYFLGASELRMLGASETLLLGASEYRLAGASEVRFGGASEQLVGGASERAAGGASEVSWGGASERVGWSPGD